MVYKQFDIEFLKRYFDLLSKHKRNISKRYGNKCEKEIFVKRTFHKWFSWNTIHKLNFRELNDLISRIKTIDNMLKNI